MTEAEYVKTLRNEASHYIDVLRAPTRDQNPLHTRWVVLRDKISPHTVIALCDAWLDKNGDKP